MWRGVYWALLSLTALGVAGLIAISLLFEPRGDPIERSEGVGEHCLGSLCVSDVSFTLLAFLVVGAGSGAFFARMLALREEEAEDSRDWEWFGERRGEDSARREDE